MKRNFSLIFFLKQVKNSTEVEQSIYLRITISRKRAEAATGKTCLEGEWQNGQLKGSSRKAKILNAYLHQLELEVHDAQRRLLALGKEINAQSLMDELLGKSEKTRKLKEAFEQHNKEMEALVGSEFSKMTLLRYQTALRHVGQFMLDKYKISDIDIKRIDHKFLTDYDFFLRSVRKLCISVKVSTPFRSKLSSPIRAFLFRDFLSTGTSSSIASDPKFYKRPFCSAKAYNHIQSSYISSNI